MIHSLLSTSSSIPQVYITDPNLSYYIGKMKINWWCLNLTFLRRFNHFESFEVEDEDEDGDEFWAEATGWGKIPLEVVPEEKL